MSSYTPLAALSEIVRKPILILLFAIFILSSSHWWEEGHLIRLIN